MNIKNIKTNKTKYFYTVLFLNNYFPAKPAVQPKTKLFEITEDINTATIKWIDDKTLWVRHNLNLPLTLQMWDNNGKPIFYCPILKDDIASVTVRRYLFRK